MVRVVTMVRNLAKVSAELEVFTSAFRAIVGGDGSEIPMESDINELVGLAVQTIVKKAGGKDVVIHRAYDPQPLPVRIRKGEIFLALLMLLQNAVDAASDTTGSRWVKVSTETASGNRKAQVLISNNGPKIAREDWEKIGAEPFSHKENGTGFGLLFAHHWIESNANNGEIAFDRNPRSELTTFSIMIPLSQSPRTPGTREGQSIT